MSKRRKTTMMRCPRCAINISMCFCEAIKPVLTKTHVSVIFHCKEFFLTSNTGKIANSALINSSYQIRGLRDKPLTDDFTHNNIYTPYYLYPSDDAIILDDDFLSKQTKPINLIVPDATWRQTKRFHKREPSLHGIQHVKVPFLNKSIYQLRRQSMDEGLCTIEAIAFSLRALGEIDAGDHLLEILKVMNKKVMDSRAHPTN